MTHTRNDGSPDEPVETRMVEVRPHVYVAEDFARANGMSRYIPPKAEASSKTPRRQRPNC